MSMIQVLLFFVIGVLLILTNKRLGKQEGLSTYEIWHLHTLLLFQMGAAIIYHWYISVNGGDSIAYWNLNGPLANPHAEGWWDYFGIGYPFMYWLNYLPAKLLGWEMLTGHLLYAILGFLAFRLLFLLKHQYFTSYKQFFGVAWPILLLYLPNLHFWSAGIGKEALCFLGLSMFVFGMDRRKLHYMLLAALLVFMVRPYLIWIIGVSLSVSLLLFGGAPNKAKYYGGALLLLCFLVLPLLLWRVGLEEVSLEGVMGLMKSQFNMLSGSRVGSSLDMANYNLIERLISYWFSPLIMYSSGIFGSIASMENLLVLVLFIGMSITAKVKKWSAIPFYLKFGLVLFVISSLVYANILANMGIMMRMKSIYMLFPIFMLIGLGNVKESMSSSTLNGPNSKVSDG
ncbi:hypothetical protein [Echinicola sediminis]